MAVDDVPKVVRPEDIFIVVLGMTGAGKTKFISQCTGEETDDLGNELSSCSSGVTLHTIQHGGKTVHLIDTPGLDDTTREDEDVFQELVYWLIKSYQVNIRIAGIIYLHRITDPRLQGSAYRGLRIFKKMCGVQNYRGIVLATTRWAEIASDVGSERVRELKSKQEFWGDLRAGGSIITDTAAGKNSALKIIGHFAKRNERYTLQIQKQMVEGGLPMYRTDAGQILYQTWKAEKERLEVQAEETLNQLNTYVNGQSQKQSEELEAHMDQVSRGITSRLEAMNSLKISQGALTKEWDKRTQHQVNRLRQERVGAEQALRFKEDEYDQLDVGRDDRLEAEIRLLRGRVSMLQKSEESRAQTYSILSGASNVIGIACAVAPLILPLVACVIM